MSRKQAIMLLAFTLWPWVYMAGFFAMVFVLFVSGAASAADGVNSGGGVDGEVGASSALGGLFVCVVIPLHLLTMLEILALTVLYVVLAVRCEHLRPEMRAIWAVLLVIGNILAMPVYWYLYVWRDEAELRPCVL